MKCDYCQLLLSAYSDGMLCAADRQEVEQHLDTCERCRREWRALQRMETMLSSCVEVPVPANMPSCILTAAQQSLPLPVFSCEDTLSLLSPYIDSELDDADARCVLNHISVCDDCYAELHALECQSVLVGAMPTMPAPFALKEAIMQRVAQPPQSWFAGLLSRARAALTPQPRWSYGFAVATVAVLAVALAANLRPTVPTSPDHVAPSKVTPPFMALKPSTEQSSDVRLPDDTTQTVASKGSEGSAAVKPAVSPVSGVTTMPVGLRTNPPTIVQPSGRKPQREVKSTSNPSPTNSDGLGAIGEGMTPPTKWGQLDVPEDPTPTPPKMKEGGEDDVDVTTLLASAQSVPYASGLSVEDSESEAVVQPVAATSSASRKIPVKMPAMPLPKGSAAKDHVVRGRRMDGLPRVAVFLSFKP